MQAFSYEGDHAEVTLYGVIFPRGVPVETDHPALLKKLPGNGDFKAHGVGEAVSSPERKKPGRPPKVK